MVLYISHLKKLFLEHNSSCENLHTTHTPPKDFQHPAILILEEHRIFCHFGAPETQNQKKKDQTNRKWLHKC